ncbi:gamma-glutamylcyclotransferase [Dongia sedimenti]|uniref:glutathione-specific gamma-glutamylcyclotransferase n=1 Tax=Dongia sedimenti TaxID=3064282 RepID=A0ABU0YQ45_9PROT|nr:gamma-glutamylcyclotransferase [Rhodospirillaceae bacterium R-7]
MPTETETDDAYYSVIDQELIESRRVKLTPGAELRVFGYGSLMWRPDFPYIDIVPATLHGYHRAFCIRSTHYRGTRENPGLVLGLDRGGMCHGRMFRVKPEHAAEVAEALHQREMVTGVYEPRWLKVRLEDGGIATALAYVADRKHPQYAGKLEIPEIARRIRLAIGRTGSNVEYLRNTVLHLEEMGIHEGVLHRVLRQVEQGQ